MHLVILNVADPFAAVAPDSADELAQTVARLDAKLTRAGHESIVMACEGSVTEGILLATPNPRTAIDETSRRTIREHYRFILQRFLLKWPIDLIHMHGGDFYEYLPPPGVPVLITLHGAARSYPENVFRLQRPRTFLHCAANRHQENLPACPNLLPEMEADFGGSDPLDRYFNVYERLVAEARSAEPQSSATSVNLFEFAGSV